MTGIATSLTNNDGASKIFPNPNSGIFNLKVDGMDKAATLNFYNSLGELIYSEKIISFESEINLSDQPKGIYFYQIVTDEQSTSSGKIIIQ